MVIVMGFVWYDILWLLVWISIITNDEVETCGHIPPNPDDINHVFIKSQAQDVRFKRDTGTTHHNLRIHLTYDDSVHHLTADKQNLIKNQVMSKAIEYWEEALKIKRLSEPIKLARSCASNSHTFRNSSQDISERQHYCINQCSTQTKCGDMVVPEEHLQGCRYYDTSTRSYLIESSVSEGVQDADFLLYVAANNTNRCQSSVAYATYCQLEVEFDRPIAGFINICPDDLSTHETQLELAIATIKHEILHALGFSLSLFGFYRDSDGIPLTPRDSDGNLPPRGSDGNFISSDRVVNRMLRTDWNTVDGYRDRVVSMMVTPKVKAEVRRHFNCSTLEGAELEDQGPSGTRLTHWEKRVFENELMTGIYTQNPVASRITLALMEDTGWYIADYSYADELEWGENLGCDFAKKSCYDWISSKQQNNQSTYPFCTDIKSSPLKTECTAHRKAMSLCNMHEYPLNIASHYRYSNAHPRYGGIVEIADYCPYLQEFNWKKDGEFVRGSECTLGSNNPDADSNFAAEYYGSDSRCFDQTKPYVMSRCQSRFVSNNYGSGCYKYLCVEGLGLVIYVSNKPYRCYRGGQIINVQIATNVSYHEGDIICPRCADVCEAEIKCPAEKVPPVFETTSPPDIPCGANSILPSTTLLLIPTIVLCVIVFKDIFLFQRSSML